MKLPNHKNAYIPEGKLADYLLSESETPVGKTVRIVTVWFMRTEKSRPSFVTAYPV